MRWYPPRAVALLVACSACAAPPARTPDAAAENRMGPRLSVTTDRDGYRVGDTIGVTLTVSNPGPDTAVLSFATGQRYDMALVDAGGRLVWRWSEGMMFVQMLGAERLAPGDSLVYRERAPAPGAPGRYVVEGRVPATEGELVARADVTVTPR